jgi:membrane protein YqaA with SNARE-associated domain
VDSSAFLAQYGLYGGTAVFCFLGGVLPFLNVEAYLLVIASTMDAGRIWLPLAAVAAVAHMAAKLLLYAAGRGIGSGVPKRYQAHVEQVRQRLERWRYGRTGFVFASAFLGFPPFYAVSILAGMLRFGWIWFVGVSLPGRFLRFAAFLLFPQVCVRLYHLL